ncbi:hypothetical protein F511_06023 [Dorcoceras hygrometricum]|uniref:BRCT domain-containing protein n=1 Tax=Dorcoceras hygrometricum TaxID=472368 RepID=A0A2Z7B3H7_9LAMI|nr:hypothetical protein F511_06023 [Dorcoceras hygrometricum]
MSSGCGSSQGTPRKRNLPSWMSSKEDVNDGDEQTNPPRRQGKSKKEQNAIQIESEGSLDFSELMEGVVFVLSGFVNPERGILRSHMLEMGAEYQPDWDSKSTLLVCSFPNTPKFRQVEADGGTIISKMKSIFSPAKVKKWAVDDLKQTISWLENQDEKPDTHEINNIAAEGILTCLQDAVDALKQGQDIQAIAEAWACVPRLVKELAELDSATDYKASFSKEDLCREAMTCKQIYELEYLNMLPQPYGNKNAPKDQKFAKNDTNSDETLEMTEEEIDEAYNSIASPL